MLLCDPFQGGTDDWKDPQSHRITKCFTGPGRAQEDFPNGSYRGPLISCSSSDALVPLMSLSSEKRRNKRLWYPTATPCNAAIRTPDARNSASAVLIAPSNHALAGGRPSFPGCTASLTRSSH